MPHHPAPSPSSRPACGLVRGMGLFSACCLIVANMVGTGIFTTSGYLMQALGDPWLMLACWLVGG